MLFRSKVAAEQIREELGRLGRIEHLRAFHFTDPGGVVGPLGWSCLVRRGKSTREGA